MNEELHDKLKVLVDLAHKITDDNLSYSKEFITVLCNEIIGMLNTQSAEVKELENEVLGLLVTADLKKPQTKKQAKRSLKATNTAPKKAYSSPIPCYIIDNTTGETVVEKGTIRGACSFLTSKGVACDLEQARQDIIAYGKTDIYVDDNIQYVIYPQKDII